MIKTIITNGSSLGPDIVYDFMIVHFCSTCTRSMFEASKSGSDLNILAGIYYWVEMLWCLLLLLAAVLPAQAAVFTPLEEVVNRETFVTLGLTLINIKPSSWPDLRLEVAKLVRSLLYHSPDTNIHFVIVTDNHTLPDVDQE